MSGPRIDDSESEIDPIKWMEYRLEDLKRKITELQRSMKDDLLYVTVRRVIEIYAYDDNDTEEDIKEAKALDKIEKKMKVIASKRETELLKLDQTALEHKRKIRKLREIVSGLEEHGGATNEAMESLRVLTADIEAFEVNVQKAHDDYDRKQTEIKSGVNKTLPISTSSIFKEPKAKNNQSKEKMSSKNKRKQTNDNTPIIQSSKK